MACEDMIEPKKVQEDVLKKLTRGDCMRPQLLVLLWLVIEDHDNLFIMAESVHFLGIGLLIYKLMTKKNAGGALPAHLS